MDVKVNLRGVDAVVTVADAAEAASLLASIADENDSHQQHAPTTSRGTDSDTAHPVAAHEASDDEIRQALMYMSGNPSAILLSILAKSDTGCTDKVLKEEMQVGKIAATLSHVTKCCKKAGIAKDAVYRRQSRKLGRGRVIYHYAVTDEAKRLIATIPDFDKAGAFPDFEDFEIQK